MFNKKIVSDFRPRTAVPQTPVNYTVPLETTAALPERIIISESNKIPLPPVRPTPGPVIRHEVIPSIQKPLINFQAHTTPSATPLNSTISVLGPAACFSPSLETYPSKGESYFVLASDGAGSASNWSEYPAISTVNMAGYSIINASSISTNQVLAELANISSLVAGQVTTTDLSSLTAYISDLTTNNVSTNTLTASLGYISTVSTQAIVLDGNELSTAGNELLFNGQPIATVSSISTNVAAWSQYPALSTILADNNNISQVGNIQVSTINGQPYVVPSSLVSTWSQYPATSAVDFAQYNLNNVSTINGQPYTGAAGGPAAWSQYSATQTVNMANNSLNNVAGINLSSVNTQAILTAGAGNVLNVNGVPVATGGGASTWANFPAISTVVIPDKDLNMTTTTPGVAYNTANLNANVVIGNTSQAPLRPDLTAYCGTVSLGGLANPLTAMNVYSLGSVAINSAAGISVAGGGGVSVSGAGGVSVTGLGNLALSGGNVEVTGAGGVLVNGTGAITVTAGGVAVNGGGVSIAAGGCAITAGGLSIAGGTTVIGSLGAAGGGLTVYGSDLFMSPVGGTNAMIHTNYLTSNTQPLQITGLSTINGSPLTYISTTAGTFTGTTRIAAGNNVGLISDIPGGTLSIQVPDSSFVKSIEGPTAGPITGPIQFTEGSGIQIDVVGSNFTFTNTKLASGTLGSLEYSDGAGGFLGANDLIYTASGLDHAQSFLTVNGNILPLSTNQNTIGTSSNIWADAYTQNLNVLSNAVISKLTVPIIYDAALNPGTDGQYLGWASSAIRWQNLPGVPIPLTNKVIATSVGTPSISSITWTTGQAGNRYVPLVPDTSVTYRPPVSPQAGQTGWRFSKLYALIAVPGTLLTTGNTYTIVAPGTINWTAIGAAASTAGTQFKYNGAAVIGLSGTVTENSKISWYSINLLYNVAPPIYGPPAFAFAKATLRSAWFLVKFNADIAVQGSLAIQIDTYAYQFTFPGPPFPSYTGRWAYSFPLQQNVGFSGAPTTNLTTSTATPRLKGGFTYLLYAGDYSSVGMPGPYYASSSSYLAGGSALFAPSQNSVTNTLKDPYDIYPDFPHIGLTSCSYSPNATQPPYGGANPYSDPAAVQVASIYLNTSSTAPYSGVGQTVTDFNVIDMGYTTSFDSVSYPMSWIS